jgi:cell division protein FtsW
MERRSKVVQQASAVASKFSVRRHRPDYRIALYMGLLMMLGLVVIYAIGPQRAQVLNNSFGTDNYTASHFYNRQALSLFVALVAFMIMARFPFRWLQVNATKLLLISLAACLALAIAGMLQLPIAPMTLGAVRWFELGPFGSVQPAEFLKFALVIFVAGFLGAKYRRGTVSNFDVTLIPLAALVGLVTLFVVVLQKNLSTGIVLAAIVFAMLFAAGLKGKIIASIAIVAVIGIVGLTVTSPHRMERVSTFFQGDNVTLKDDDSRHITQAKIAIGSGGLLGLGIGNSVQATGYLPEAINDSVFAIMGEIFGFVGLVAIMAIFIALLLRLLYIADHLSDIKAKLVVVGIFAWLTAHTVINIAAMIGLAPLTGITLPLVSFGGTSMVFMAGALGLVFQLSRYTVNSVETEGETSEDTRSRRGLGRTRYANRRST